MAKTLASLTTRQSFEIITSQLLDELYNLIIDLQSKSFNKRELSDSLKLKFSEKCEQLSLAYQDVSVKVPERATEILKLYENLSKDLKNHSYLLDSCEKINDLKENLKRIAENYEKTLIELKKKKIEIKNLTHLKPKNYFRNLYHVLNALTVYFLYTEVFNHTYALMTMGGLSVIAITVEITRQFNPKFNNFMVDKVFGKIVRPKERFKVNSATYYLVSLTLMMTFAPAKAFLLGLLTLGISDPVANIIGKNFGKRKIYGEKSLEGTLAFFLSSFIVCTLSLLFHLAPDAALLTILPLTLSVAIVGAIVELYSSKLDDNMTIIISCTLTALLFL